MQKSGVSVGVSVLKDYPPETNTPKDPRTVRQVKWPKSESGGTPNDTKRVKNDKKKVFSHFWSKPEKKPLKIAA